MDNQTRRILLERVKASGFPGSILDVFQNPAILDQFIAEQQQSQLQQPQNQPVVAQTPQEQEQGLRPAHAAGNVGQSMIFPNVEPNQSFNTVGMKIPIDINKVDNQGNLVESYKAVPPGIQDLPTGPNRGMVIESPAEGYAKTGGVRKYQTGSFDIERIMADMQYPGYTAPTVDIVDYKSDKQRKKEREELERSARILPSGAINSTFGPLDAAVGVAAGIPGLLVRGLQAGVPAVANALNAPAVIGSTTLPGVTMGNILGAAGAAHSTQQILDPSSELRTNPNAENVLMTGLGFVGLPYKSTRLSIADDLGQGSHNVHQAGFFNLKGALQKYPKGKLTQEEIDAFKNSRYYKETTKQHLEDVKKYGDRWKLPNYAEETLQRAIETGNRDVINHTLYGGHNWGANNYIIAGLAGTAYPGLAGVYSLAFSPPAVKNKVLNAAGITSKPGVLSSKDTTINITNIPMDFAKVNETADGKVILGGEFIEDANNTVRKAKDWETAIDTYSDQKYSSKDIQSFYGIENGKFKVGKASDFNPNTEIVPRRFGAININQAVLNEGAMRLLDDKGKPIYQNTPNTGKFILYSPSTKDAEFNYITSGESGVNKVNNFLKKNKDAQYIHLDNGRYEFYGLNPEGLSGQDFRDYYQQDLERKGNPGYNLIIKRSGGVRTYLKGGLKNRVLYNKARYKR